MNGLESSVPSPEQIGPHDLLFLFHFLGRKETGSPEIERCVRFWRGCLMTAHVVGLLSLDSIGYDGQELDSKNLIQANFLKDPYDLLRYDQSLFSEDQLRSFTQQELGPQIARALVATAGRQQYYFQSLFDVLSTYPRTSIDFEKKAQQQQPKTRKERQRYVESVLQLRGERQQTEEFDLQDVDIGYRISNALTAVLRWAVSAKSKNRLRDMSAEQLKIQDDARHSMMDAFLYIRSKYFTSEETLTLFSYLFKDLGLHEFLQNFSTIGVKTFGHSITAELSLLCSLLDEGAAVMLPSDDQELHGIDLIGTQDNVRTFFQAKGEMERKRVERHDLVDPAAQEAVLAWIHKTLKGQRADQMVSSVYELNRYAQEEGANAVWVLSPSDIQVVLRAYQGSMLQQSYFLQTPSEDL